ncbi:MAG: hypothetical protein LWW75_10860 [Chlorobiales bacterium]|nr:hypothetical protein [Chlorobiales bacterium]
MREDLQYINIASMLGFSWAFEQNNKANPIRFWKGPYRIWKIRDGWQTAVLRADTYQDHQSIERLMDAFLYVNQKINKEHEHDAAHGHHTARPTERSTEPHVEVKGQQGKGHRGSTLESCGL